jgi:hypothetical protein
MTKSSDMTITTAISREAEVGCMALQVLHRTASSKQTRRPSLHQNNPAPFDLWSILTRIGVPQCGQ